MAGTTGFGSSRRCVLQRVKAMVSLKGDIFLKFHRVLQQIKDAGAQAAAALNPATPLAAVEDVIEYLDLLLLMTVNPGWGGQQFIRSSLGRLRRARQMIDAANPGCALEVDGGIYGSPDSNTALEVVQAGADTLVAGSAVYGHPGGVAAGIAALREAVQPALALK